VTVTYILQSERLSVALGNSMSLRPISPCQAAAAAAVAEG